MVHELNGYRHDVVAAMARYKDERALEFNAMEHIEQIDTLLQRNAAVLSDLPPRTPHAPRCSTTSKCSTTHNAVMVQPATCPL